MRNRRTRTLTNPNIRRRQPAGMGHVPAYDPELIRPARREELMPVVVLAVAVVLIALWVCATRGLQLLYGDAVAHIGIARRIVDTRYPGLGQLGGVWLPLPHLLMVPFVGKMEWWQNGMAGAWPAMLCYVLGVVGFYRLARRLLVPRWAAVATAFYGLNPNLLYLATTPMTEPLFLALLVWIVLLTLECVEAMRAGLAWAAGRRMIGLGMLILCAVLTRYDGWILGAAAWCLVAWNLWRLPEMRARLGWVFAIFTVIVLAGPVSWFWYNHAYEHDWLDFLRGPGSPKEIDRKTSPPGSHKYWGWHNPAWSLMLYARTAQVDAAWWELGWLLAGAALWGGWLVCKSGPESTPRDAAAMDGALKSEHRPAAKASLRIALLLWFPLPFYVYSISYGSVPIFIPQLYPHSFYNSRYGLEMLPCLALFGAAAVQFWVGKVKARNPVVARLLAPVAGTLCVLNCLMMAHATPLVLHEAEINSVGRVAIETALAAQLDAMKPGAPIMMDEGTYIGALQRAGIPLKQVVQPGDYYKGLTLPSEKAAYVVAIGNDAVSDAVKAHPEGLTETTILCSTGQACARIYASDRFR